MNARLGGLRSHPIVLAALVAVVGTTACRAAPPEWTVPQRDTLPTKRGETFVVDDFDDDVTRMQLGYNAFGGNNGVAESAEGLVRFGWSPDSSGREGGSLKFDYDFGPNPSEGTFGGVFLSQFGLTDTKVDLTGSGREPERSTPFPDNFLDTTNLFGDTRRHEPARRRSLDRFAFDTRLEAGGPIRLRVELKDEAGHVRYAYVTVDGTGWSTHELAFPDDFDRHQNAAPHANDLRPRFDRRRVSLVTFLVESRNVGNRITNPPAGRFLVDDVRWRDVDGTHVDTAAARGDRAYDRAFLEHVRETSFRYFVDFAGTDPRTGAEPHGDGLGVRGGLIGDRSTFSGDLFSLGGEGFALSALCVAVERGYLSRFDARRRAVRALEVLAEAEQGPDRIDTLGTRGFFYHFAGTDGRRKHNFDFAATPDIDESRNTIELSPIDTALALCGVVCCRQFFDRDDPDETRLRELADRILYRVDWPWMLEPNSRQWYLGWKPIEEREDGGRYGEFRIPDREGTGHYSSRRDSHGIDHPATIDHYTDEELLISLLAIASPNPRHRLPPDVFFTARRTGERFTKTHPGALFTYQFAACWLPVRRLGADRDPAEIAPRIDYFENTRAATLACIDYCDRNPRRRATLDRLRYGLTACDGVFDDYHADAAPPIALGTTGGCHDGRTSRRRPLEVGTATVYGVGSSILHTPEQAIAGLWECERLGLLHPRFGFCDAYNLDVADAVTPCVDVDSPDVLRSRGRFVNRTGYAIDHGPMLLLIDAYLEDDFLPELFVSYPPIARALPQLFPDARQRDGAR